MKKSNVNFRSVNVSADFVAHVSDYVASTATKSGINAIYDAKINPLKADLSVLDMMVSMTPQEKSEKVSAVTEKIESLKAERDGQLDEIPIWKSTKEDNAFGRKYQACGTPDEIKTVLREYFAEYGIIIDNTTFEDDLMMIGLYKPNGNSKKTVQTGMCTGEDSVQKIVKTVISVTADWMISARAISSVQSYVTDEVADALRKEDERKKALKDALKARKKARKAEKADK